MAQLWKPGVLKANMPEHMLVRFTVANVMPGWDPKWLEELLAKTEETLRTPAHPLVKAFGPFSPTKLDSWRLSMLMQGVASALVAAKKKEKTEATSAQKATTKKETASPAPKKEEEDEGEKEALDEEDEGLTAQLRTSWGELAALREAEKEGGELGESEEEGGEEGGGGGAATAAKETKEGAAGGTAGSASFAPAPAKKEEPLATAARESDSGADSEGDEGMDEVRIRRFVHLTDLFFFYEMVKRKLMPQSVAATVLEQTDKEYHGQETMKAWFQRQMFQQLWEKGLVGKEVLQEMSLEGWSRKIQLEVQKAAEKDLWIFFVKLVETKMEEYIRAQGLRVLGSEVEERDEDVNLEEEAVDLLKMGLYHNRQMDEKMASLDDDPEEFQIVSRVRILFSDLAGFWGVEAINGCMDAVMNGIEIIIEEEVLGGNDRRKVTVEARKLALPEKEKREKREVEKVDELYRKRNKQYVEMMDKEVEREVARLGRGGGAAGTEAERKEDGYSALEAEMRKNLLRKLAEKEQKEAAAAAARAAAREKAKAKADAQARADARTAARMRQRQEEEEEEARKRLQEQQDRGRFGKQDARHVAQAEAKKAAGTSKKTKATAATEDEGADDDFEEEEDLLEWMKQSAQVALEKTRRKKGTATSTTMLLSPPPLASGRDFFRASREGAAAGAAAGGGSKVAPPGPGEVMLAKPSMDDGREMGAAATAAASAADASASAAFGRPEPILPSGDWVDSTGEAASGSPTEGATKKKKKKKKTKKKKKQGGTGTDVPMWGVGDGGGGGGEEEEDEKEDEDEVDAHVLALVRAAAPVAVPAPIVAPAPPVAVAVAPAAQAAAAGSGGGGGGEGNRPGTIAGRAAAAMVARAQAAAAAKQKKEEEEQRREGGDSSDGDEVFAASLKATAARLGKLGKLEGAQGGGGKKGLSPPPAPTVFNEESIPSEYVCPISFGIMYDPVIATDGHSYERAAIEEWIETRLRKGQPITSPFTNDLMDRNLIPNRALRNLIRAFCEEHSLRIPTGPAVYTMG